MQHIGSCDQLNFTSLNVAVRSHILCVAYCTVKSSFGLYYYTEAAKRGAKAISQHQRFIIYGATTMTCNSSIR
eukprot:21335-Heterococcus_DN1.PRE.3